MRKLIGVCVMASGLLIVFATSAYRGNANAQDNFVDISTTATTEKVAQVNDPFKELRIIEHAVGAERVGDWKSAFLLLKPLAEQGNASAQFLLGLLYENGQGVSQDSTEAMKWYRKAAAQGNAEAVKHVDMKATARGDAATHTSRSLDDVGTTVPNNSPGEDWKKAREYEFRGDWKNAISILKSLAEQGVPEAQIHLGDLYERGHEKDNHGTPGGVPQDHAEALKWYRMEAEKWNDVGEMIKIGEIYENGLGDYTKALKWYRKAAEQWYSPSPIDTANHKSAVWHLDDLNTKLENISKQVEQDKIVRPKLAAKKDIGDTVCKPGSDYIYGQVEKVHKNKIQVRRHYTNHDELEWIEYNEVYKCDSQ